MQWLSRWLKPSASKTDTSVYQQIGGEEVVAAIASSFYDIMREDSYAAPLYAMHPKPLDTVRQLFRDYLIMWMGGHDNYTPMRGHPRLRARHLPFKVTPNLKAQWMYCMRKAMHQHVNDSVLTEKVLQELDALASHMINTENE